MNTDIVLMVIWAVAAGWLGARWDSGVLRRKRPKPIVLHLAMLALSLALLSWGDQRSVIARFWWYHLSGQHHVPSLEVIGYMPLTEVMGRLFLAFLLTVACLFAPFLASYELAKKRTAKRQERLDAEQAAGNE